MKILDSITTFGTAQSRVLAPATNNFFIGANAGNTTLTGGGNIGIGQATLFSITTGNNNLAIGNSSMLVLQDATFNTAIGHSTMLTTISGATQNVAVGMYAMTALTTGSNNTAVGFQALKNPSTHSGNTAIGTNAMTSAGFAGDQNTAVGYNAGQVITTGNNNTIIGQNAGNTITTGSGNIIIGQNQQATAPGAGSEINIGGILFGYTVPGLGRIAVGTATPQEKFHISTGAANTVAIQEWENTAGNYRSFFSTASPEGVITGNRGDVCHVNTGTIGEVYLKVTGVGNTGWQKMVLSATTSQVKSLITGVFDSNIGPGGTRYLPLAGSQTDSGTESNVQYSTHAGSAISYKVRIATNGTSSASTITLRKNGANTALSISIPASSVGTFTATGNVAYATDDTVSGICINGGGGSIRVRSQQLVFVPD